MKLFEFKTNWYGDGRSARCVIKGPRRQVLKYIPKKDFLSLFGGYVVWKKPRPRHPDMPDKAIGVWGRRKVSRFRRILRERGAEFEVVYGEGPRQRPSLWRYSGGG